MQVDLVKATVELHNGYGFSDHEWKHITSHRLLFNLTYSGSRKIE